ncbi:hypothetical protein ACPCSP_34575 [Streptomyces cinereoruber]|uniref:hypothetical protein n=1 Tax=Streptomyces cinereoruber TaxID=67260 RepID=UPI003C302046
MTVHTSEQPERAGKRGTGHTGAAQPPVRDQATVPVQPPQNGKVKVLATLLAVVVGIAAALAAYIVGRRVTQDVAEPFVWAAATFIGVTTLATHLIEKSGLTD